MSPDAPQLQQKLSAFASRARDVAPKCNSEATTKNFLIAPYIDVILGYNPFNPDHCVPEYSADIKGAGDKVDYALLHNGKPIIIVEAKSIGTIKTNHATPGQLNGYFVGCEAQFAALTDGLIWNWYRARPHHYQLEDAPFLSHDVRSPSTIEIHWLLSILNQTDINPNQAHLEAMAVKMKAAFLDWLHRTRENPSDQFLKFLIKETQSEDTEIEIVRSIFVGAFGSLFLDEPPPQNTSIDPRSPAQNTSIDPRSPTLVLDDGKELHRSGWYRAWRPAGGNWIVEASGKDVYRAVLRHLSTTHVHGPDHFFSTAKLGRGNPFFLTKEQVDELEKGKRYKRHEQFDRTHDRWLMVSLSIENCLRRIKQACKYVATPTGQDYTFSQDLQVWLPSWNEPRP